MRGRFTLPPSSFFLNYALLTQSICTKSSLLTVIIVTCVWNTTSTHSGTFQNGRPHTEPDTVKNRLFSFFLSFFFSRANSILAQILTFIYTYIRSIFSSAFPRYHSFQKYSLRLNAIFSACTCMLMVYVVRHFVA